MPYLGNTPTTQSFTPAVDLFSGNGSTTAFTLSRQVASVAQVEAVIENVPQSPNDAYTVSGNTITFTSAPPSGTNNIYVKYTSPITQVIMPSYGTVGQNQMTQGAPYWDVNGNLGIGTSSPSYKLDINGAVRMPNATVLWMNNTSGVAQETLQLYSDNNTYVSTPGALIFRTNGTTERARIDSSGNLLVGTTSNPNSARLVVKSAAGNHTTNFYTADTTGQRTQIGFYDGSGDFCGQVYVDAGTNTTVYATSSDYRLKENVQPMQGALATVEQLNPVTYTWKSNGSDGQGFIAHELQAVFPECVSGEKDAVDEEGNPQYQGIDTSFLVATLTAAIQEQQALIQTLTERIAALEAK
jgi:hypothetical protein